MNKKKEKHIKKFNSLKKQLKKNLSFLKKHIYNYKLEIILSILALVIIFLIIAIYSSSNLVQENKDDNNFAGDLSSNEIEKPSIDDYLVSIEKTEIKNSDDFEENIIEDNTNLEFDNNEENQEEQEQETEKPLNDFSDSFVNSFGDSFSSAAYLNLDETNMYLDDISTALTFRPLYKFAKLGSCGGNGDVCDFQKDVRVLDYGMQACIENTNDCLKVINEGLYYNGEEISLPDEISSNEIISLTAGALDSKFLLGAVIAQDEDEYGLVYYFDGNTFENIITKNSEYTITSKYHRQGGRIGFGGSDDNFIILYAGYRAQAFQVHAGEIIDITDMFGLRVMNKGFMPQIIQSGDGIDSTWYVCSLDKKNPKLIKLWQNGSKYIQGSLDFTYEIYTTSALYDNFNHCYLSANDNKKLYLTFGDNNDLDIWQFQDGGFDNSHDYSVVSSDILNKEAHVAKNAIIKEVSLSVFEKGYASNIEDYGTLYLSTDDINWQKVDISKFLHFNDLTSDLYWRLDLISKDDYFSPWFNSINRLNYLVLK